MTALAAFPMRTTIPPTWLYRGGSESRDVAADMHTPLATANSIRLRLPKSLECHRDDMAE